MWHSFIAPFIGEPVGDCREDVLGDTPCSGYPMKLSLRGKGSSSAGRFAALSLTRLCQGVIPLELAGSGAPVDSVDESGWSSSWSAGSTSPFGCPSLGCSGWTCGLPVPPRLAAAGDLDLSVSGGLGRTSPFCAAVRTILLEELSEGPAEALPVPL